MTSSTVTAPVARSAATRRALTVAGATAAAAAVWLAGRAAGADLTVTMAGQPPMTIGLPAVLGTALAASAAGWATLAALQRWARRGRTWWTLLASVVLAASFVPVLSVRADGGTRLTLALIHLTVAAVLIPLLPRSVAGREKGRS
ncbi:MAG TPA: DUF6069 family protein [Micromonosporaceae bacterium]